MEEIKLLHSLRLKQLKAKYDSIGDFIYGYARVENRGKLVGYIDTTYQFKYDDVAVLYDGILSVKRDNHYGVINNSKEIIPIKYDSISLLGDKMLRLGLNGRFCLANIEGVKLTPLKYHKIEYAMNGIYAIYFDKWVFVDSNIVEVDIPNNIMLYSTNNDTPIDIERYDITYNSAFGQVPVAHNYQNGNGLLVFKNNDSVTSIGDSAFYNCSNLTSITIPDSVTSIGKYAFSYCSNLTSITIPDSVTSIGHKAFYACDQLAAFYGKFSSEDNRCLIVDGIIKCFAPASLTQYSISKDGTTIGDFAFSHCSNLTSITIPDSVTSIEGYAFYGCSHLTEVIIPDSVTSIGEDAFSDCSNLTSIIIPNSVTSIGSYAFSDCSNLTSITISDSVTSIGDYAFYACSSLTSITIPDSVISIGEYAFSKHLEEIHCKSVIPPKIMAQHIKKECTIYVPTESVDVYKSAEGWKEYAERIEGYDFE